MKSKSRSVLDTPLSRSMTTFLWSSRKDGQRRTSRRVHHVSANKNGGHACALPTLRNLLGDFSGPPIMSYAFCAALARRSLSSGAHFARPGGQTPCEVDPTTAHFPSPHAAHS